jgi:hypothetical protein
VPDEAPDLRVKLDDTDLATQYCKEMNGAATLREWILNDINGEMGPAAKSYVAAKRRPQEFDVQLKWQTT